MSTSLETALFVLGACGATAFVLGASQLSAAQRAQAGRWLPLLILVGFIAASVSAVVREGPFGFVREHTRGAWSTQIWFDLLIAASVAFYSLAPRARRAGMRLSLWGLGLLLTGSIALVAMVLRLHQLEARAGAQEPGA